jgi:hypothetical protein
MNRSFWNPTTLSWGTGHAINVYPLASSGTVTPSRTIVGPTVDLDKSWDPPNLAVDETNGEYWIAWVNGSSQMVFEALPRSPGGDATPARAIGGAVNTNDLAFSSMFYDAKGGSVVGVFLGAGSTNVLRSWPRTADGDVAPSVAATFPNAVAIAPAIDYAHDLLFLTTDSGMTAIPRAFPAGTLSITNIDTSAVAGTLSAVDGEGDELYFLAAGKILVAPRPAGSTLTLARTITGTATGLYNPLRLSICN